MVTDFLPTSLISNEHSTPKECISRQIISLSKLGFNDGVWWRLVEVGGECTAGRGGFLLPNHSPAALTVVERLLIAPADKGWEGRVATVSRWSCQMFYVEENCECNNPIFSKGGTTKQNRPGMWEVGQGC